MIHLDPVLLYSLISAVGGALLTLLANRLGIKIPGPAVPVNPVLPGPPANPNDPAPVGPPAPLTGNPLWDALLGLLGKLLAARKIQPAKIMALLEEAGAEVPTAGSASK